ncbi:MAG: transposase [Bifidobacteriaceae bacterium]|nr:transposase [Bifidobacteriaceae bacterium]
MACLPALSLEACCRRSHGSGYKALRACRVDRDRARDLLAGSLPAGAPRAFAIDASTWPKCDAETSPGRGFYYSASRHSAGQPIVAGWCYQVAVGLDWAHDSWTRPVDQVRIQPGQDPVAATVEQIKALARRLPPGPDPVFALDAGYDPAALTRELANARVPAAVVVRVRDDRVFHADPAPNPGANGRPRRHGARRACRQPETWPSPDRQTAFHDASYGLVDARAWDALHPKLGRRGRWADWDKPPIIKATIVKADVQHLPKGASGGAKKTLWLWIGAPDPDRVDLETCVKAYLHRFDIEHTFRFMKNTLGWTTPKTATPEQADTWTWLTLAAYTQLRLARPLVADRRLPWERPLPPGKLTPGRVRRGFGQLARQLGTPARPPKPSRAGPGRPKGSRSGPRTRHPAVKTTPTKV